MQKNLEIQNQMLVKVHARVQNHKVTVKMPAVLND